MGMITLAVEGLGPGLREMMYGRSQRGAGHRMLLANKIAQLRQALCGSDRALHVLDH